MPLVIMRLPRAGTPGASGRIGWYGSAPAPDSSRLHTAQWRDPTTCLRNHWCSGEPAEESGFCCFQPHPRAKNVFPFDDPLRFKVDANWRITAMKIAEFFTADQQALEEIFRGCTIRSFTKKCSTTFGYGQPRRAQRRRPGRVRRVSRISGAMNLPVNLVPSSGPA
jgi:hypothetical protein